jgi:uncharacterized protein (DUF1810 family)
MWFVFPQVRGLGQSAMAHRYGTGSLQEAQAYLAHRLLGPRLRERAALVFPVEGRSIAQILGSPDDLKFHSSVTLFAHTAEDQEIFTKALGKYCAGTLDPLTMQRLQPNA